jgi:hypothetical protein
VVVGGWVPDLLMPNAAPEHIGSIDVDLALDAAKLGDGPYAELLKLLLDTGRYEKGDKDFQLVTMVDLADGEAAVRVEVEFLAPADVKLKKNHPKLVEGCVSFRMQSEKYKSSGANWSRLPTCFVRFLPSIVTLYSKPSAYS